MKKLALTIAFSAVCVNSFAGFVDERKVVIQPAAPVSMPVVEVAPVKVAAPVFDVSSTDKTVRDVLVRWSKSSGWKHDQFHWTLARDYPIEGTASADQFGGDFKNAVRALLSSTESTDVPVQPCFYTNLVVRVVPKAELCDRNSASK